MDSLSILDSIMPPAGFRTSAALGTTYSVDLVACLVILSTLDRVSYDQAKLPDKIHSLRALERLRSHVRIAVQQGCIHWNKGSDKPILSLLDRIVRPVRFNGNKFSFHPKVFLVRYERDTDANSDPLYRLIVGSRNYTTDLAWDMGISLIGTMGRRMNGKTVQLSTVFEFLSHVCGLIGEPGFRKHFPEVQSIRWSLPDGAESLEFAFTRGQKHDEGLNSVPLLDLVGKKAYEDVLIISPFLDGSMVEKAARSLGNHGFRRLVSGPEDLSRLAATKAREFLSKLNPHFLEVSKSEPEPVRRETADLDPCEDIESESVEERQGEMGLHAKVIAVRDGGSRASVLIGSPNFTSRAWKGSNCEAYCILHGDSTLADLLWGWSDTRAARFNFESEIIDPAKIAKKNMLDNLRNTISNLEFTLDYTGPIYTATFYVEEELPWKVMRNHKVTLHFARLTFTEKFTKWPHGKHSIRLPTYPLAEHTEFIVMRLESPEEKLEWVQSVRCKLPPDDNRDKAALIRYLGISGFMAYLRSLLGEDMEAGEEEYRQDISHEMGVGKRGFSTFGETDLSLEEILQAIVNRPDKLREIADAVRKYEPLITQLGTSTEERRKFREFLKTWEAIEKGWQMP